MGPDHGAVDHLQHVGVATAVGAALKHDVEHARDRPAAELLPHRVPVAELSRKVAPLSTGPSDPEYAVEHATVRLWRPPRGRRQEWLEDRPLLVGHQTPCHRKPPSWRFAMDHIPPRRGNLEVSVRSRDGISPPARQRDLIEAGLNCAAGPKRYGRCMVRTASRGVSVATPAH